MEIRTIQTKWSMIFSQTDLSRMQVSGDGESIKVVLDTHGLKCVEARVMINNIAATIRPAFTIQVIHGYNHGHDTKDMIADETKMSNKRIRARIPAKKNPGVTDLVFMGA